MYKKRTPADDEADRKLVIGYVQARPGQDCEEAEIKNATGVAKALVRNLVSGSPGIDPVKLSAGKVCWNPPKS